MESGGAGLSSDFKDFSTLRCPELLRGSLTSPTVAPGWGGGAAERVEGLNCSGLGRGVSGGLGYIGPGSPGGSWGGGWGSGGGGVFCAGCQNWGQFMTPVSYQGHT